MANKQNKAVVKAVESKLWTPIALIQIIKSKSLPRGNKGN